jgi:hypothetical protein
LRVHGGGHEALREGIAEGMAKGRDEEAWERSSLRKGWGKQECLTSLEGGGRD